MLVTSIVYLYPLTGLKSAAYGTKSKYIIRPNTLNCGFGYFVIIIVLAFIGLVFFLAVIKWYQYRERDDPPFDQMAVEEVYVRKVNQNTYQAYSPENNIEFANSLLADN